MTSPASPAKPTIMDVLRDDTACHHEAAEHHPFQTTLNKGQAPVSDYHRYLTELFHLHRALEAALKDLSLGYPSFRAVIRDYQYQVPYLLEDLEHFGISPDSAERTPATAEATAEIERAASENPHRLLGMHYVLEGSKNGAKYISRNLMRAYGLTPGPGLRYFDPYGENQRPYWAQFKSDMNDQAFDETDRAEILRGAVRMFEIIRAISDDLQSKPVGATA